MTKEEKAELKIKIEAEAIKLKTQIEELKEEVKPIAPENAIGRLSRMDAINNRSVNEAALRKAEIRLNALEEAKQILAFVPTVEKTFLWEDCCSVRKVVLA